MQELFLVQIRFLIAAAAAFFSILIDVCFRRPMPTCTQGFVIDADPRLLMQANAYMHAGLRPCRKIRSCFR